VPTSYFLLCTQYFQFSILNRRDTDIFIILFPFKIRQYLAKKIAVTKTTYIQYLNFSKLERNCSSIWHYTSICLYLSLKKVWNYLQCDNGGWEGGGKVQKNYIDLTNVTIIYLLKFKNTYVLGISVTMQYYGTVQIEITTAFNGHNQRII
jgi:hypothetical protein